MKIQELRNLIRNEVRKAINESTFINEEDSMSFADEFATSRDVIKFFQQEMLPAKSADVATLVRKPMYNFLKNDDIFSRPSGPKLARTVAEHLKFNKINSLADLYKANKMKYTDSSTLKEFVDSLKVEYLSRMATVVIIPESGNKPTLEVNVYDED